MFCRMHKKKYFCVDNRHIHLMRNIPQQRYRVLSGSTLKVMAMASMLIDHIGCFIMPLYETPFQPYFTVGSKDVSLYFIFRLIGRLAFPIFAFLLVEGFMHTHNHKRYVLNLFVFALLSEIPWNLVHDNTLLFPSQNVLFTLTLGLLGLEALTRWQHDRKRQTLSLLLLFVLSIVMRADYGCAGFSFILLLYILRGRPLLQCIIGSSLLPRRWLTAWTFIPLAMYDGRRGFIQGRWGKYLFYAFYPTHLLILYLVRLHLMG